MYVVPGLSPVMSHDVPVVICDSSLTVILYEDAPFTSVHVKLAVEGVLFAHLKSSGASSFLTANPDVPAMIWTSSESNAWLSSHKALTVKK